MRCCAELFRAAILELLRSAYGDLVCRKRLTTANGIRLAVFWEVRMCIRAFHGEANCGTLLFVSYAWDPYVHFQDVLSDVWSHR